MFTLIICLSLLLTGLDLSATSIDSPPKSEKENLPIDLGSLPEPAKLDSPYPPVDIESLPEPAQVGPVDSWKFGRFEDHGISPYMFSEFVDFVFEENKNKRTNALVVIHNGKLIFEQYARNFQRNSKMRIWSISKTVSALLVMKAVEENYLKLEEPLAAFYPKIKHDLASITVNDLMNMSSGIDFNENYTNMLTSSTISMLYGRGNSDVGKHVRKHSKGNNPGEHFYYSSGDSNLLMALLKERIPNNLYSNYPWTALFEPLEINSATFERDSSGTFMASSYMYLRARDLAKVGQVILKKGKWKDKQIISSKLIEQMTTLSPALVNSARESDEENESYGQQVWLNKTFNSEYHNRQLGPFIKSAPESLIIGRGYSGQRLYILPHKNLVIVRLAHDIGQAIDWNKFIELALNSFERKK